MVVKDCMVHLCMTICVLATVICTAEAAVEIDLARLLQFRKDDEAHGSQLASLSFVASYFKGDVLRKIAFMHLNDIEKDKVTEVLTKKPNGLVLILPQMIDDGGKWPKLQEFFYDSSFPMPIYFAFETEEIMQIYNELLEKDQSLSDAVSNSMFRKALDTIFAEDYSVSISVDEPKAQMPLNLENYYYLLNSHPDSMGNQKPIILLSASYDAFSISPDLSFGLDTNGSGLIALFELFKIFSKLFATYGSLSEYDLMFLLTPSSSINYKGTEAFLSELSENIPISFALCLDSIAGDRNLYLHMSRSVKEKEFTNKKIIEALNITSKQMGVGFGTVLKPINQSMEHMPWEHERFAYKRISGATLSARSSASRHILEKSSIYDNEIDTDILKRNIEVIAESLSKVLFEINDETQAIFTGDYPGFKSGFIEQMIQFLKQNPRFPTKLASNSETLKQFHKLFAKQISNMTKQSFEYKETEFYAHAPTKLKIIKVKSRLTDMFLFVVISLYLFLLYLYVVGPSTVFTFLAKKEKRS